MTPNENPKLDVRYCHEDNVFCSVIGFFFYAISGSGIYLQVSTYLATPQYLPLSRYLPIYLQAALAVTRYTLVCCATRVSVTATLAASR